MSKFNICEPKLGLEQQEALEKIIAFLKDKKSTVFSLYGSAGTGKSLLETHIIKEIEKRRQNYCLCAPTHKAALVMRNYTQRDALTLHSLLALSPNIEILELDLRALEFVTSHTSTNSIPNNGVVICDEASMISDDLFDLLVEKCKALNCKIIFISDYAQLLPVKAKHHSKVYQVKDKFQLTHIYRQSKESALMPVLSELRQHAIKHFDTCEAEQGSLVVDKDFKEFFSKLIPKYQEAIKNLNILKVKVLAYTNNRITKYNEFIRKFLWNNTKKEYVKGELLTAYCNGVYDEFKYYNSMDYIVQEVIPKTKTLPNGITVKGFDLTLYDPYEKESNTIFMLSKNNPKQLFEALAGSLEVARIDAINVSKRSRSAAGKLWKTYYDLFESFTTPYDLYFRDRLIRKKTFDYGYAQTVHKSQGSSYDEVFVDIKNINTCKEDLVKQQLQYVALSRTRTNAYIYA